MIFDVRTDHISLLSALTNVGLTSGCFDLFHHMHLVYLQKCKRNCDRLFVGIDSDELIKSNKGPKRPLVPEHERAAIINGLKCVTGVFIMHSLEDFEIAVRELKVAVIFKNQDFVGKDVLGQDRAKVMIIPDTVGITSSTAIIEEIRRRM